MQNIAAASLFVAIAVTSGIAAAPAPAPIAPPAAKTPAGSRSEAMARLQAADADKDGRWSRAEWAAAGRRDRGFDFIDADSDGFVTVAEIQGGMQKLRAMRGGQ